MNTISIVKGKAVLLKEILSLIYYGGIAIFVIIMCLTIAASFLPAERFSAEKGGAHWYLTVAISGTIPAEPKFSIGIPFSVLSGVTTEFFNAKCAFFTFIIPFILFFFPTLIYGAKQLHEILISMINNHTPFTVENGNRLKKLSYIIIGYSLLAKPLINILMSVFIRPGFSLDFSNINLSGVLVGFLLLLISDIFNYGVYLQQENDATL